MVYISGLMQVKSIQRQISSLTASLDSNNAEARANAQAEIDRLQRELTNVCAGRVVSRSGLSEERNYVLRARAD
jgi:multidrug resistance efflux pump